MSGGVRVHETMTRVFLVWIFVFVSSVSAAGEQSSNLVLVVAAPRASVFTEWSRNWCNGGIPAKGFSPLCSDGGFSMGGEISSVFLYRPKVVVGSLLPGTTHIGIAHHALKVAANNSHQWLFVLERSSADFRGDTGLDYIAREYAQFESSVACLGTPLQELFQLSVVPRTTPPDRENCYTLKTILGIREHAP